MFYKPAPIKHKQTNKNEYDKTFCPTRPHSTKDYKFWFERGLHGCPHTTSNLTLDKEGYHDKIAILHHQTTG